MVVGIPVMLALFLGLCAYWMYWRWTHRRFLELVADIPGPPGLPLIGNAWEIILRPNEVMDVLREAMNKYGQYTKVWWGDELIVCVKNPADIRMLLSSNKVNQKGSLYYFMSRLIGPGLLSGGYSWRNNRKLATPSYNPRIVQTFAPVFNKAGKELVEVLSRKDPNVTFNVYYDIVQFTTLCVNQKVMGLSEEESRNVKGLQEVILETHHMYDFLFKNMSHWWYQIPPVFWLLRLREERRLAGIIDVYTSDVLAKRRAALAECMPKDENLSAVDRFILSGQLSDHELKLQAFALFTASQESTAKIISTALLILAQLPQWQEKVYNEIMEVVGDEDFVTDDHLKRMVYLDAVYKEANRFLPIGCALQRKVEKEVSINDGKYTLPAGSFVIIPVHEIHRDPQFWDEPNKIDPGRFLPEYTKKFDPNAFIPYSVGAMDCIGRNFATAMIKTLLVHVVRQVEVESDGFIEDLAVTYAISVKLVKGYHLRVRQRQTKGPAFKEKRTVGMN